MKALTERLRPLCHGELEFCDKLVASVPSVDGLLATRSGGKIKVLHEVEGGFN